jgi:hypothetical protein
MQFLSGGSVFPKKSKSLYPTGAVPKYPPSPPVPPRSLALIAKLYLSPINYVSETTEVVLVVSSLLLTVNVYLVKIL